MKHLSLFAVAVLALAPPVQSQTSATASIAAEFTRKIDSKDAKAGDQVAARTTAATTLADGTDLPKGTRLTGTVTSVRAKSGANKTAHIAFTLDRAILRDGSEIPLHATLTSLSAPAPFGPPTAGDSFATSEAAAGGPVAAGASHAAAGPAGGAVHSTAGTAASTASMAPKTIDSTGETESTVVKPVASTGLDDIGAGRLANGSYVSEALRVHHYQVANMPGVILSSQVTARDSGWLDANGQNISLESGTRMTMNASLAAR